MNIEKSRYVYDHKTPPLPQKIKLYFLALIQVPFYRYGEFGNLMYTVGKNILEGVILYTMFSMAERELKVAAILGVMMKYIYPGITIVSSTYTSGFIDHLESFKEIKDQISQLIKAQVGIGIGQSVGALFLLLCFPPVFKYLFYEVSFRSYLIIIFYLCYHIFDGSSQIVEGRTWFKIIEIKIRMGNIFQLSHNFWVIYVTSQNFQLILGQIFIWSALGITTFYYPNLTSPVLLLILYFGLICTIIAKFILPVTYKLKLCS